MLAELDGHDSKMEDACSQKVSCGDTLTSHFFQTEQSPFLMFFFPFLRALESSCLYFDPPVCLMKILCLALPAYISDHPSSFLASSLQASPRIPSPFQSHLSTLVPPLRFRISEESESSVQEVG